MLSLVINGDEYWDDVKQEFIQPDTYVLKLEHSLVSISKWESRWHKPFFSMEAKTYEETVDYIKCMTLVDDVDPFIYERLTNEHVLDVNSYIENPMTATIITDDPSAKKNREIITSELIYYWMIALNIPMECQYWHFNRLMKLIEVCNVKNKPPKKMSPREIMARNAELNAKRRQQLKTNG